MTRTSTSGANEGVRNRVEEVLDLDVIVDVDPRAAPFRELPVLGWQRVEDVPLDLLEQITAAEADFAHGALVHALHDRRDRLVAFGEREERQRAQSAENVGLREPDAGLDLGFVSRLVGPRRQDADRIVRRHRAVGSVDLGIVNEAFWTPLFRLSGTSSFGAPPKKRNMRTCAPVQSANCCVQVASA